ncbi:FAD-dependent oxidoreductase [Aureibacillus halotolerans]|uniref:Ferredoxin-NADP reductase n=1 Tax=Aureibacillus halotolerans TaxID=1508390 RepID=A0A4R6TSI2_9BACI|nr:FAD-dependent oxidoreductase [Aureibacillus halotolerans]TDQ36588.1 ferredoxin-NADP reductase [Aureibacillus halotolerans]
MSFLKDTLAVFKKTEVSFLEKRKESDNVYTFRFKKEKDVSWHAGQYALFTITHKKIKKATRPFTISSSPTEDVIQITSVINEKPSEFKQALLELEKGMTVKMSGSVGTFYSQGNAPLLLIAGGIGVTPFRAMIKQLESEGMNQNRPIKLIHVDGQTSHIFKDELESIVNNIPIDIMYLESRENLHKEIDAFVTVHKADAHYYVAGPKSMVEDTTKHLQESNIPKANIKKDAFFGY